MAAMSDSHAPMRVSWAAALLLAYVALRQGDAVGVLTLAGSERWSAPRKSLATMNPS